MLQNAERVQPPKNARQWQAETSRKSTQYNPPLMRLIDVHGSTTTEIVAVRCLKAISPSLNSSSHSNVLLVAFGHQYRGIAAPTNRRPVCERVPE